MPCLLFAQMPPTTTTLLDLAPAEAAARLNQWVAAEGLPKYRSAQLLRRLWVAPVGSWQDATELPKSVRDRLDAALPLPRLTAEVVQQSQDGTRKFLWALADGEKIDTLNTMVWRMNPRRLDIESYRDTLLRAAGRLDPAMYGPSEDIDAATSVKRTVYGRVSRGRLAGLLKTYDFPDPMQTAGGRDLTTNALQQFFVMNSAFMHEESLALAKSVGDEPDNAGKLKLLYRKVLSRDANPKELDLGLSFLIGGKLEDYAQILLSTNEEIFWP